MKNIFKILIIITVGLVLSVNNALAGGKMPKYANNYVKFIKQFKTIIEIDYNEYTNKKSIKRYNKYFKVSVVKKLYNYDRATNLYDLMINFKGNNLDLYVDTEPEYLKPDPKDVPIIFYYDQKKYEYTRSFSAIHSKNNQCMAFVKVSSMDELKHRHIFLKTRPKGKITAKTIADICQDKAFDITKIFIDVNHIAKTITNPPQTQEPEPISQCKCEPESKPEVQPSSPQQQKSKSIGEDEQNKQNIEKFIDFISVYKFHLYYLGSSYSVTEQTSSISINRVDNAMYWADLDGLGHFYNYNPIDKSIWEYNAPTLTRGYSLKESSNNNCIYMDNHILVKNLYVSWAGGRYSYGGKLTPDIAKHICEDYIH